MRSPGGNLVKHWAAIALVTLAGTLLLGWPTGTQAASPSTPIALQQLSMESAQVGWGVHRYEVHPRPGFTGQLLHTTDGGRSWRNVTPPRVTFNTPGGWPTLPHNTVTDFLSGSTAWIATELSVSSAGTGTILLSTTHDGGARWQQSTVELPKLSDRVIPNPIVDQAEFVNSRVGWLVFGPDGGAGAGMSPEGMELWRTINGGRSWIRVNQVAAPMVAALITFTSPTTGWLVENRGLPPLHISLMHSVDGGQEWTRVSVPATPEIAQAFRSSTGPLASFSGPHALMVAANGSKVMQSDDHGLQWSRPRSIPGKSRLSDGVEVLGGQIIWDEERAALWRSVNGGKTWTVQSRAEFLGPNQFIDFLNARVGWTWYGPATQQAKLWMTTDGGKHWTRWTPKLIPRH